MMIFNMKPNEDVKVLVEALDGLKNLEPLPLDQYDVNTLFRVIETLRRANTRLSKFVNGYKGRSRNKEEFVKDNIRMLEYLAKEAKSAHADLVSLTIDCDLEESQIEE